MSINKLINSTGGRDFAESHSHRRYFGVYVGTVTDNKHEQDEYRVRVMVPSLHENQNTFWARVANMMSGTEMGSFWLPEVDDEVLIAFANGDDQQPIVIGNLWNGKDKSIQKVKVTPDDIEYKLPNNQQDGKNNYRMWQTRSGHTFVFSDEDGKERISLRSKSMNELVLDDTSGKEKIQLYDINNTQWLEIDVPGKIITMQTDTGEILIKAKTTITMDCKDLVINASNTIKVESGSDSEWKAGANFKEEAGSQYDMKAGGNMNCKAAKINLN